MNILVSQSNSATGTNAVCCPGCHWRNCPKHAVYIRKWFHVCGLIISLPMMVQRYRCLNPDCPRSTFSILPPMVLRYCRFFWPCLLTLQRRWEAHVPLRRWNISNGVALRAAGMFKALTSWVEELYREVTDGGAARELGRMVKTIIRKIGRIELSNRWYRHRYPLRFGASGTASHNLSLVNHPPER